jgi:hypothetical protein
MTIDKTGAIIISADNSEEKKAHFKATYADRQTTASESRILKTSIVHSSLERDCIGAHQHSLFGVGIEGGSGFVHACNRRLVESSADEADKLALADGPLVAS